MKPAVEEPNGVKHHLVQMTKSVSGNQRNTLDPSNMIVFGPVPSRRLGQSLGINNIPPKTCTFSCIYCQLGRTTDLRITRDTFYKPETIFKKVKEKVDSANKKKEPIDYLTFVSNGEPSLDVNLGKTIEMLKVLEIKIAVITNASLLWNESVRSDLCHADWVSLKIDAISQNIWHGINNPHDSLDLYQIWKGITHFAHAFNGELTTETMLVRSKNDQVKELNKLVGFIAILKPDMSYLSSPIRPPAKKSVAPPTEKGVNRAYQIFTDYGLNVAYLTGYEGNAFTSTGNVEVDILSITAVHPMMESGLHTLLDNCGKDWGVVERLICEGKLTETKYRGKRFYLRTIPTSSYSE